MTPMSYISLLLATGMMPAYHVPRTLITHRRKSSQIDTLSLIRPIAAGSNTCAGTMRVTPNFFLMLNIFINTFITGGMIRR